MKGVEPEAADLKVFLSASIVYTPSQRKWLIMLAFSPLFNFCDPGRRVRLIRRLSLSMREPEPKWLACARGLSVWGGDEDGRGFFWLPFSTGYHFQKMKGLLVTT